MKPGLGRTVHLVHDIAGWVPDRETNHWVLFALFLFDLVPTGKRYVAPLLLDLLLCFFTLLFCASGARPADSR